MLKLKFKSQKLNIRKTKAFFLNLPELLLDLRNTKVGYISYGNADLTLSRILKDIFTSPKKNTKGINFPVFSNQFLANIKQSFKFSLRLNPNF